MEVSFRNRESQKKETGIRTATEITAKIPKLPSFRTTSPSTVGSITHDDATMPKLQQPCSSSSTTEQEQQEPTKAMGTLQPCYSQTPIVPHPAAQSNDLREWPLTYEQKKKWAARGSLECQHMNSDFTKSKRFL